MKSRLAELQALWKEVRYRHNNITFVATAKDRKKLSYFTQKDYYVAEDAYYEAADYLHDAMDSFVKPEGPMCDPKIDSAFCDFAGVFDTVPDDSRSVEDAYNEAANYLQKAIGSFVKPVGPVSYPSTDSITCDLAGTVDTITDNSRNKGRSFVNNVSVQNCELSTDTTVCDFADPSDIFNNNSRNKSRSFVNDVSVPKCVYCPGIHSLENCEKFLLLSVEQRNTLAREMQVCFNCLRSGHFAPKCPSNSRCIHCRRMHHSLLHLAVSEIADAQVTRTDVSRASDVLRATAWMNPHTAKVAALKSARYSIKDRRSVLFPNPFVGLCERHDIAPISEYVDLGKIVPAMRGRRLYST